MCDKLAKIQQKVTEAAFDYKLGCLDDEFAALNSGVEKLKQALFDMVSYYEEYDFEEIE